MGKNVRANSMLGGEAAPSPSTDGCSTLLAARFAPGLALACPASLSQNQGTTNDNTHLQLGDGDAGPLGDHGGHLLGPNHIRQHAVARGRGFQLGAQGLAHFLQRAVADVGHHGQVHARLGLLQPDAQLLLFLLQRLDLLQPRLFLVSCCVWWGGCW
ncbi:hypothetical protein F751_2950 [Auxenochlorella protothecoides]|uniref:Uncharacterized protein n=1 Tax=Auxenochlorella protothecoides TaxID=3075 RepID=A0A087SAK5_AUXPR|nr:hypothetical protein F751_2950 [Auxenochlorella protothecoides]KFM22759.1 hypothetical protein F751_2950 [Auxenochlorella protothecoides]